MLYKVDFENLKLALKETKNQPLVTFFTKVSISL
jgi:hypothetical protein